MIYHVHTEMRQSLGVGDNFIGEQFSNVLYRETDQLGTWR